MDIQTFIQNFKEAFGESAELPLFILVFGFIFESKQKEKQIGFLMF